MAEFTWLPPEVNKLATQSNEEYIDILYTIFTKDFIDTSPIFRGIKLALKKHPKKDDKEATFWHLITCGSDEQSRTIDLPRCSKLPWVMPTIDNEARPEIKIWENIRKNETRIVLWIEAKDYVVVLAKRNGYILPWTAYPITYKHTKEKLEKEYLQYTMQKTSQ
ncbi:MAG TPA: hypothetical protein DF296_06280 [Candidatus Margulisbacteria bacterium]|nr:hypothetical protein [Candidatus Margulisiibacteriota bacterium]